MNDMLPLETITVANLGPEHIGRIVRSYTNDPNREEDNQLWVTGQLEYVLFDPKGVALYDPKTEQPTGEYAGTLAQLKIGGVLFSFPAHIVIDLF